MQLLAQEEYGLRCLVALARAGAGASRTIQEIAREEGLSADYAAKLLRELRRGGLVESTRGAAGGYRLARPPEEIRAWDVIDVLGGRLFPDGFCACHPGQRRDCVHESDCAIRALWRRVDAAVREVLAGVRLSDLCGRERELAAHLAAAATPAPLPLRRNP